ncbi:O-antigen ligase family protein [Solemya elarraichensis gill symbiont]|uniref:O-antigen ligase family protein n=1 Tax=Solemya elarraichensis gill symbiont TaxID=1918949 RepID=UPI0010837EB3|nr:O-antigen ligase family protein [Solemya elarraichensis gill symbiont]
MFRAGNLPIPLLLLELGSLILLYQWLYNRAYREVPSRLLWFLALLLIVPLIQLLPVPVGVWSGLPGRDVFLPWLQLAEHGQVDSWRPMSLAPMRSEIVFWALLPPVAMFLAVYTLSVQQLVRLAWLVIAMALFQTLLALAQYVTPSASPLHDLIPNISHKGAGTWFNTDHFAGFLEMVFPMTLGLLIASLVSNKQEKGEMVARMVKTSGNQALLHGLIAIVLLIGIVYTRSRMGIALMMFGLFISMLLFSAQLGRRSSSGTLAMVLGVVVVVSLEIGLAPVLGRFAVDPTQDYRWLFFATSMEPIGSFFPLGSGAGSFPSIYPAYQPLQITEFVNHLHNDYLEWIFDTGLMGLGMILFFFALYLKQWTNVWQRGNWHSFRFLQVGAGIGILLIALHTLMDFNLRKPANALYFAFLLALFFKQHRLEEEEPKPARRRRQESRREEIKAVPKHRPAFDSNESW